MMTGLRRTLFHRTTVFRILSSSLPLLTMVMVLMAAAGQQRRCCGVGVQAFLAPAAVVVVQRSATNLPSSTSSTLQTVLTVSKKPNTKLSAFATADAEGIQRARNNDEDDSSSSWTPVQGGFLPRFRTPKSVVPLVREIRTLEEYRQYVVQPPDTITVVRFYAPWCRACKAVQPKFQRLSRQYASASTAAAVVTSDNDNSNHRSRPSVQFVEVPLTAETAVLHTGLGVPSLPYGHIYSNGLLVEERKMNKHVFAEFEAVLQTYVQGYCPVQYNTDTGAVEWLRE